MQPRQYQHRDAIRGHPYFHVHRLAPTRQEWRHTNPIRKHLLHGRFPIILRLRLRHKHYGSAGGEESFDPRELEGVGREDCEFNL